MRAFQPPHITSSLSKCQDTVNNFTLETKSPQNLKCPQFKRYRQQKKKKSN